MDEATKHRNYETDRKVRFTDDNAISHQNIHRLKISKVIRKRRASTGEYGVDKVTGAEKSEKVSPRSEHSVITKSRKGDEEKTKEIAPAMTPCEETYTPLPPALEDERPSFNKGNPDNLLQTILRKMTAAVEDYDYHVDMTRGNTAEYNEKERDEVKLAIYDRITDFYDHIIRRDDILRSLAQRLQESGSKDNMRATQKFFQQELMEQKALRKSQKEVQMALQSAITELLHSSKKHQNHKEVEVFSFDEDGNFNSVTLEMRDTDSTMQDWKKKVEELHELLRKMTLEKHGDHTSFIATIDKMAEHISTLTSLFEKVLRDYEQLKKFVVVLNEALQKLSAQNREVHQMILALEDELSEARSTIVSMENRYGQHSVQMINKWTLTGQGFYEEELEIPQVVIEAVDPKESDASSFGIVSQSEDEISKSLAETKKKKRKRRRSISKPRRIRSGSKSASPDMYLSYLLDRDNKLEKASSEIANLKDEIDRLKKMSATDNSAEVHSMADNLMGQVLKIGKLKNDLESFLQKEHRREPKEASLVSSRISSPRTPSPLAVIQGVPPSTSDKIVQVPSVEAVATDYTSFALPPIHDDIMKLRMKRSTKFKAVQDLTKNFRFEPQDFPVAETNDLLTSDNEYKHKSSPESYLAHTDTVVEHLEEIPPSSKTETSNTTPKTNVSKTGRSFSRSKSIKGRSNKKMRKKLSAPSRLTLPKIRDIAAIDGKLYLIQDKKEKVPRELPAIEQHLSVQQSRPDPPSSLLACRETPQKASSQLLSTEKVTINKDDPVKSNSSTPLASVVVGKDLHLPKLETSKTNMEREVRRSGGTSAAASAEWVTMEVCKKLSLEQPLTKVSISNMHPDEETTKEKDNQKISKTAKEKDNQNISKPTKKTRRLLRPTSRPPLLLHYHFPPKIFPKHITSTEPLTRSKDQPPLSHFTEPQPLGLSMRKVDLQPRNLEKSPPVPMYGGYPPSPDASPYSSRPSTESKKYRNGAYYQQQYSRREDVNDVSNFWKLRFNSPKKSYDTMPDFSNSSEDKNVERALQGQPSFDRSRHVPKNSNVAVKNYLESTQMPLEERKYSKQRKKIRYIDTF